MSNDSEVTDETVTTTTTTPSNDKNANTAASSPSPPPPMKDADDDKPSTAKTDGPDTHDNGNGNVIGASNDEVITAHTSPSSMYSSSSSLSEDSETAQEDSAAVAPSSSEKKNGGGVDGTTLGSVDDYGTKGGEGDGDPTATAVDGSAVAEEAQSASCCSSSSSRCSSSSSSSLEEEGINGQVQGRLQDDDGNDSNTTAVRAHVGDDTDGNDADTEFQQQQQEEQPKSQIELLQQHVKTLTLERDSALSQLHDTTSKNADNGETLHQQQQNELHEQTQILLTELQQKLRTQTSQKAELEHVYHTLQTQNASHLQLNSTLEDEIEQHKACILQTTISRTSIENEVSTLRQARDTHERTEMVLQNRLNDAKKKEAQRSDTATRLQIENTRLTEELAASRLELKRTTTAKDRLEGSLEKLKRKVVERVKASDAALVEERNLNEERKRKMKAFVEHKAEELKAAKILNDELRAELVETSGALENVRNKVEARGEEVTRVQNRNRDLVREVTRMKKNSEHLHQMGDNLELELHKSTQETEEHKNKRQTAKHELMAMLRKLEAEKAVCSRLRDSVKFTFTPKALSQQQLLTESLQDFEANLLKLSRRLGKPLPPSPVLETDGADGGAGMENGSIGVTSGESESSSRHGSSSAANGTAGGVSKKTARRTSSRSELDTSRLLSNLECETQSVSKCIMALGGAVERLHVLLDDSGEKSCVSTLNKIFLAMAEGKEEVAQVGVSRASAGVGAAGSRTNFEQHGLVQSQNR